MFVPINTPTVNPRVTQAQIAHTAAIEAPNKISRPTGPEQSFVSSEGIYVVRERIEVAIPPPHPNDISPMPTNALDPTIRPPAPGCQLSLVAMKKETVQSHLNRSKPNRINSETLDNMEALSDSLSLGDPAAMDDSIDESLASSTKHDKKDGLKSPGSPISEADLHLLSLPGGKRRKPKNKLTNTSSSFVSRIMHHRDLQRKMTERSIHNVYVITNTQRTLNWWDISTSSESSDPEPLSRVLFTRSCPLCHDVNQLTRSVGHLDVIVGFATGDLIWYDPITSKYVRINKQGNIVPSAVTYIRWLPHSETRFIAAHANGVVALYDKEREDPPQGTVGEDITGPQKGGFNVLQSAHSTTVKSSKFNPMAIYGGSSSTIYQFAFDPRGEWLATVDEGGNLQIFDVNNERLNDIFHSYYGGLHCVCWSPDGNFVLTGGQDDLVTIWSFSERRMVARCRGHQSWVKGLSFDAWRCDERAYRFGSVGEDGRLFLWDFSINSLARWRVAQGIKGSGSASQRSASIGDGSASFDEQVHDHPIVSNLEAQVLHPVVSKKVDSDPLDSIVFREDAIYVSSQTGHVSVWNRPETTMPSSHGHDEPK